MKILIEKEICINVHDICFLLVTCIVEATVFFPLAAKGVQSPSQIATKYAPTETDIGKMVMQPTKREGSN